MSKAILIIDMPDNCQKCPCMFGGICFAKGKAGNPEDIDPVMTVEESWAGKPDWCPLWKLPERKETTRETSYKNSVRNGWNACLDAITEGERA